MYRLLLILGVWMVVAPPLSWGGNSPRTDITVTNSATLVCPANSARTACNVTNNDAAVNVRWGDNSVTTTKGQRLRAAASIEIRGGVPVYMISEGANVTVSVTEEIK